MATWYLSQCSMNKWMSLTARWRVPHPVRPKINYGSKVLWSWESVQRSRHTSLPRSGVVGRGYHLLCWTLNIWSCDGWEWFIKTLSKPAWTGIGEVLPWKCGNFLLDFILVLSNLSTKIRGSKNLWYHPSQFLGLNYMYLLCIQNLNSGFRTCDIVFAIL